MPIAVEQKPAGEPNPYQTRGINLGGWVGIINPYGEGNPYGKIVIGTVETLALGSLIGNPEVWVASAIWLVTIIFVQNARM